MRQPVQRITTKRRFLRLFPRIAEAVRTDHRRDHRHRQGGLGVPPGPLRGGRGRQRQGRRQEARRGLRRESLRGGDLCGAGDWDTNVLLFGRSSRLTNQGELGGECASVAHPLLSHDLSGSGTDSEWQLVPLMLAVQKTGRVLVAPEYVPVIQNKQPVLPAHKLRETEVGIIIELLTLNHIASGDLKLGKGVHNSARRLGDNEADATRRILPSEDLFGRFVSSQEQPRNHAGSEDDGGPKHQYELPSHAVNVDGNQVHCKPSSVREEGKGSFRGIGT